MIFIVFTSCDTDVRRHIDVKLSLNKELALGQYLFFDKELSHDKKFSCSTCHNPSLAFTDGYKLAFNSNAIPLAFNTPSVLNLHNYKYFSWQDRNIKSLEIQMNRPLLGMEPVEMGYHLDSFQILNRINEKYRGIIPEKYNTKLGFDDIKSEIVNYMLGLNSRNSKYDLGKEEETYKKGEQIFYSNKYKCSSCHGGVDFNIPVEEMKLPNIRIPSLRNIEITHPYWHDGRFNNLQEVLDNHNPFLEQAKSELSQVRKEDVKDIIKFLYALTDTSYLSNKKFTDPFN